jgi:beta-galactosidase
MWTTALLVAAVITAAVATDRHVADYDDLGGKPFTVTWDSRSMRLNDKPVLLQSGSIHYPRSTPAMWPGLFTEARANGLNTIEVYVFWNFHKRSNASAYDYTGSGNVALFLQLAAQHNLFVIWRFGPYVCAEWADGGLPNWLREVPGMRTRSDNPEWYAAVTQWGRDHWKVIEPFLARNGGPIIMSQIENEYSCKSANSPYW